MMNQPRNEEECVASHSGGASHNKSNLWILDGGTGREIEACGGPFRQPEWSALALYEDPDVVKRVHSNFINAGANGIITNSYACVPFHLGTERYEKDHKHLLDLSVNLAYQAVQTQKDEAIEKPTTKILGSIPPLCGSYEPEKFDPVVASPILQHFLNAYSSTESKTPVVDVLLLETIGSIAEARFYLENIIAYKDIKSTKEESNSKQRQQEQQTKIPPVWLSFCIKSDYGFDQSPALLTNDTLTTALEDLTNDKLLERANVQAIMVNCCDVRIVTPALVELREAITKKNGSTRASTIQLGACPNAFSIPPPDAANHTLRQVDYNITPELFQKYAEEWINKCGASIIGGCCGIGPQHIAALREIDKNFKTNDL